VAAGAVAGLAAARLTPNRIGRVATAFALGFLSHVALDAFQHSDYGSLTRTATLGVVLVELVVITAVIGGIVRRRLLRPWPGYMLAGVLGAGIADAKFIAPMILPPDVAWIVMQTTASFHRLFHAPAPSAPLLGLGIEVFWTLVLLVILAAFPRVGPRVVRHPAPVVRPPAPPLEDVA
jgi:hypothetical protein